MYDNNIKKQEKLLERLERQQDDFFERSRNTDVKLGIMIALISAIWIYFFPNMIIEKIKFSEWINNNCLICLLLLVLLDLSIVVLLIIEMFFALLALKTKKAEGAAPSMFGEEKLKKSISYIQSNAIRNYERIITNNLKKEEKKNKKLDICIILTLISIGLLVLEKVIYIIIV